MKYLESKKRFLLSHTNKAYYYVSLGDSIAAGHAIVDDWETVYGGRNSQYGANGNTSTRIIDGTYTALIGEELRSRYGDNVSVTSFARSGDKVSDLIDKLSHIGVREAIEKANLVTICIGANDILGPALDSLEQYINYGDLSQLEAIVDANLDVLENDSNTASYAALLTELNRINPNAKYVFTTIYNPYKYLWLEEGGNGFFKPVLDVIPQITILGIEVDNLIREKLHEADAVKKLYERVNKVGNWAEPRINRLNQILKAKVAKYQNAYVADTKLLFESVPDRPIDYHMHYNDLVNVEYTRGYDTAKMNWGALWKDSNAATFWRDLATKYVSTSGFDSNGLAEDLVWQVIEKVIKPDIDPHPEASGHIVLKRSFEDALGWNTLSRYTITYNSNGGSGSMATQEVIGVDNRVFAILKPNAFNHKTEGYYFNGWDNNATYFNGYYYVWLNSDTMVSAQWSNMLTLVYRHSRNVLHNKEDGPEQTGPMEDYELWVAGTTNNLAGQPEPKLGAFSNGQKVYTLPYGTAIGIVVRTAFGLSGISKITFNGVQVSGESWQATHDFTLTKNTDINFEWNRTYAISYWNCYITTN